MNPVIREIQEFGTSELPNGEKIEIHSHVGPGSTRVLRNAIESCKPRLGVEVGLAFGVSTLHILDAMREHGDGRLIGMDPAQFDSTWRGTGLHAVARAGFGDRYEFHPATSQEILPRLAASGVRIQFGFIDGWHTFDHTLVDFFFIDRMLEIDGIVVLDDVGYPSIRKLAHFLLSNRAYSVFDADFGQISPGWRGQLKKFAQRVLHPIVRDDFTPSPESVQARTGLAGARLIALRKVGEDTRPFDHFAPF